jgi:YggT family protein
MLLVVVYVVLSYFMDPFHPVRRAVSSWVEPILAPIRRILPPIGMIDLSPLVLILVLQLINILLRNIFR